LQNLSIKLFNKNSSTSRQVREADGEREREKEKAFTFNPGKTKHFTSVMNSAP
jgi:hypothetical protein